LIIQLKQLARIKLWDRYTLKMCV